MNKNELISQIKNERQQLDETLSNVTSDAMTVPGVSGDWSVKDILAHLAVWYSRAVTALFQAERGTRLQRPQSSMPDWSDVNARDYESQKDRPLDRILADYHGSHAQLIKRLEAWKDEAVLFDKRRFPELEGYSLADYVWSDSGEHDAEHRAQIEPWLQKRSSGNG
jgi:hypothetical protein